MSGRHRTSAIARPNGSLPRTPSHRRGPVASPGRHDRTLFDDFTRPTEVEHQLVTSRSNRWVLGLLGVAVVGALLAALFVLPVQAWMRQQDDDRGEAAGARVLTERQRRTGRRRAAPRDRRRRTRGGPRRARRHRSRRGAHLDPADRPRCAAAADRVAVRRRHADRRGAHRRRPPPCHSLRPPRRRPPTSPAPTSPVDGDRRCRRPVPAVPSVDVAGIGAGATAPVTRDALSDGVRRGCGVVACKPASTVSIDPG